MDLVTAQRMVCVECEYLATGETTCICCGQAMTPAVDYRDPTSAFYRNAVLALINQETP